MSHLLLHYLYSSYLTAHILDVPHQENANKITSQEVGIQRLVSEYELTAGGYGSTNFILWLSCHTSQKTLPIYIDS